MDQEKIPGETSGAAPLDEVSDCLREIARSEIVRHRRRLGTLTPDQQRAVENLLLTTAGVISERIISGIQAYSLSEQEQYLSLWRSVAA